MSEFAMEPLAGEIEAVARALEPVAYSPTAMRPSADSRYADLRLDAMAQAKILLTVSRIWLSKNGYEVIKP